MISYIHKFSFVLFLFFSSRIAEAQKNITVGDSLEANADMMIVKPGSRGFGKVWKIRFGEYEVVSGKKGWTTSSSSGSLFNDRSDSKTTSKFYFVLTCRSGDSAKVNAANNVDVKVLRELNWLHGFSWGNNELQQESQNFTSFITVNEDTGEVWILLMHVSRFRDQSGDYSFFMTNGTRKIFISPVPDKKTGGSFSLNAEGYQFKEGSQYLSALQYQGAGTLGMNKMIAWIDRRLDTKMKLVLAASITSVLELKLSEQATP